MTGYRSPAVRRYLFRLGGMMGAYAGALIGAKFAFQAGLGTGYAGYLLALTPALPLIGVFWAVARLMLEEPDEYLRMQFVRQCLIATGFCLTITTAREWLQNFDLISDDDHGFGAAFFWFIGLGVGGIWNALASWRAIKADRSA